MERTLQEMMIIIRELVIEVGELKEKVARLENVNTKGPSPMETTKRQVFQLEGEAYDNLGRIYDQGYHICNVAYGEERHEECIFCIAFLEKG